MPCENRHLTGKILHRFYEYVRFASLLCLDLVGPCRILRFGLLLVRLCFCQGLLLILWGDISLKPGPVRYPCTVCYTSVRVNQRAFVCVICANIGLTVAVVEFLLQNISHYKWLMCFHGYQFVLLVLLNLCHLQTVQCSVLILYCTNLICIS